MKGKKLIKDFFSYTKKETKGVISLFILIVIVFLFPLLFPLLKTEQKTYKMDADFVAAIKSLKTDSSENKIANNDYYNDYSIREKYKKYPTLNPRSFDPNTLSESGWIEMGIKPKTAATIRKYIEKGGRFKSPGDLKKIYGLSPETVEKLLPFVTISDNKEDKVESYKDRYSTTQDYPLEKYKPRLINPVPINIADTAEWIALPGIGSKLSQRIIAYREKLGGFYSIDQVGETFLLPDSTFQKIKPYLLLNNSVVKKINLNLATLEELKAHPYLRYNIANVIIQFRNQHGDFKSIEDVKKIVLITDEIFNKVAPYLTVN